MLWYKGNLHTHTSGVGSDGPASPENVVRWYTDHGYDFLAITDHNVFSPVESDDLVMVRSEEVGLGTVHINGFGISRTVEFVEIDEVVPRIQANVDAILDAGGIASLNHPNFRWGFNHEHITQVTGPALMEVYNAGGLTKNSDGAPASQAARRSGTRSLLRASVYMPSLRTTPIPMTSSRLKRPIPVALGSTFGLPI